MLTLAFLCVSFVANIALGIVLYVIYVRKLAYKRAFHRNVERCKRIIDSWRRYKELTKNLDDIFCKLRLNAKEQSSLVDQATGIIAEEKELCSSMVEIGGDINLNLTTWMK